MLIALLFGVSCVSEGTAVGNPGPTRPPAADGLLRVVAQEAPEGLTLSRVELAVTDLILQACSGDDAITEVSAVLDVLDGEQLELAGGDWCGLQLVLEDDALELTGQADIGVGFWVTLDPLSLTDSSRRTIDGQTLELTLPTDFLDASIINNFSAEESAADVEISSDDALGMQWSDALTEGIAPAEDSEVGSEAGREDCGCSVDTGSGWWLLAALVALTRRRRSILR